MSACDEIYGRVARVLLESLHVDDHEITPDARLQEDLGAESIDFLDILFRLEREFAIRIPRDELFPEAIFQGDPDFVRDGRVTEKGLVELRARLPYADLSRFTQDPAVSAISDLFTVGMMTRYITWKIGQAAGAGSSAALKTAG